MRKISQIGRFHIKIRFLTSKQWGAQHRAWSCVVAPARTSLRPARPRHSLWLPPLPVSTGMGTPAGGCSAGGCSAGSPGQGWCSPKAGSCPASLALVPVTSSGTEKAVVTEGTPLLHLVLAAIFQIRDAYCFLARTGGTCPRAGRLRLSLKLRLPITDTCCETPAGFPRSTSRSKGKIVRLGDTESTMSTISK